MGRLVFLNNRSTHLCSAFLGCCTSLFDESLETLIFQYLCDLRGCFLRFSRCAEHLTESFEWIFWRWVDLYVYGAVCADAGQFFRFLNSFKEAANI